MTTLIPKFDLMNGGATPVGAVNRPINKKLEEYRSFKDFGAVGDGVTNDTAAVQAAVNAGVRLTSLPTDIFLCTSAITIANTSVEIIGGVFQFTSNNGFVFTSSTSAYFFTLANATVTSKSAATGAAISATWTTASSVNACQIENVIINGSSASNTWNTGVSVTNCTLPTLLKLNIQNPASLASMAVGILIAGTGVSSLVEATTISNATIGIRYTKLYNNTTQNCVFNFCNTCILYDFTPAGYGAILTVSQCLFYPISFGIRALSVIALNINTCFFQKDTAGTWVGIYMDQTTGTEVFESMIVNNQFGNNLGTAPWTGIQVATGRVLNISDNQFDSGVGNNIFLPSTTSTENTIKNNISMQLNTFMDAANFSNNISDNYNVAVYGQRTPLTQDISTANPPNLKLFLGNYASGFFELGNTGGAVNVSGLIGGIYWQTVHLSFTVSNITLVNNNLTSGTAFNLQGAANYTPAAGSIVSFIGIPDGIGNIAWTEFARRTP